MVGFAEQYNQLLDESLTLLRNEKTEEIIEQVALLTVTYYKTLVEQGIPPEHAATITAHYSGQIASPIKSN